MKEEKIYYVVQIAGKWPWVDRAYFPKLKGAKTYCEEIKVRLSGKGKLRIIKRTTTTTEEVIEYKPR